MFTNQDLKKLIIPLFLEQLLVALVGIADVFVIGFVGEAAVSGVSLVNAFNMIFINLFTALASGGAVVISQYLGAREYDKVEQIYTLAVCLNLAVSLVITTGLLLGADGLFSLMQVPMEARPEAKSYLLITALSLPCQALMLTFSAFLRAHAKMLVIMLSTGIINLINIVGNTAFIYGLGPMPQLGAAGAAISTSICRTVGMLMMIFAFFHTVQNARVSLKVLRPFPTGLLKRFLGIGLPAGGEGLSYNLSQSTSLVFVNLMGTFAVTTRMYCVMFAQVCYMLISALSQAVAIVVGYCVGAKDFDQADRQNWKVLKTFTPITLIIAAVLAVFSQPLLSLFSSDPQVIALGQKVMIVEVILELGRCFNIVMVRNLQAVGDVHFPVLVGIASQWIVGVGVAWLLGIHFGLGLVGVWMAFALDENLRAVIFVIRWKRGGWRHIKTV